MAREELKKQYETDCKYSTRPWELWEFRVLKQEWIQLTHPPNWFPFAEYRRKELEMVTENDWEKGVFSTIFKRKEEFKPEFFSGLNYQKAEKLIGKKVGFSDNPYDGWRVGTLAGVRDKKYHFLSETDGTHFDYIRTCQEIYGHPTITICDIKLPRPEIETPKNESEYWFVTSHNTVLKDVWDGGEIDQKRLVSGKIHLAEDRAQEWADWWQNVVMVAVRGSE